MLVFRELETTRSVKPKDPLSRFFRSQSRWELLLLIAANKNSDEIGIWNYIDMLTTRTESPMTIYTFIRDRIDDGSLVLLTGRKKSRKVLSLSAQLETALNDFLLRRYIVGMTEDPGSHGEDASPDDAIQVVQVKSPHSQFSHRETFVGAMLTEADILPNGYLPTETAH